MEFSNIFIGFVLGVILTLVLMKNSSGAITDYNFQWNEKYNKGTYGQMASRDGGYCTAKCDADPACRGIMIRQTGNPSCWKFKDMQITGPAVYDENYTTWTKKNR